jgi:large subunit ribosomal protein L3
MLGLIGKKIGMTQVFDDVGVLTPVTVIQFDENIVVSERKVEKNGYEAVVIGSVDVKKVNKPKAGQFKEGVPPKKHLIEFRDFGKECKVGDKFGVELLEDLTYVDVTGTSKGKGFQGGMKRHNFGGGRASHGSKFHRGLGGTGMAATPSRVLKGTKMPGRMGGVKSTAQNLRVVGVDEDRQLLLVEGAVPGPKNSILIVKQAKKKV